MTCYPPCIFNLDVKCVYGFGEGRDRESIESRCEANHIGGKMIAPCIHISIVRLSTLVAFSRPESGSYEPRARQGEAAPDQGQRPAPAPGGLRLMMWRCS